MQFYGIIYPHLFGDLVPKFLTQSNSGLGPMYWQSTFVRHQFCCLPSFCAIVKCCSTTIDPIKTKMTIKFRPRSIILILKYLTSIKVIYNATMQWLITMIAIKHLRSMSWSNCSEILPNICLNQLILRTDEVFSKKNENKSSSRHKKIRNSLFFNGIGLIFGQ